LFQTKIRLKILGISFSFFFLLIKVHVQHHIILNITEYVPKYANEIAGIENQYNESERADCVANDQYLLDLGLVFQGGVGAWVLAVYHLL
jgi:hypothetical protein